MTASTVSVSSSREALDCVSVAVSRRSSSTVAAEDGEDDDEAVSTATTARFLRIRCGQSASFGCARRCM